MTQVEVLTVYVQREEVGEQSRPPTSLVIRPVPVPVSDTVKVMGGNGGAGGAGGGVIGNGGGGDGGMLPVQLSV